MEESLHQMAQRVEFMFSNVAYGATVFKTGTFFHHPLQT